MIDFKENIFVELTAGIKYESSTNARKNATLIDYSNGMVPLVRTTAQYNYPVQKFLPLHYQIMDKIRVATNKKLEFNNAMVEIYDSSYRNMKYHSDQSLDLAEDSYICLFSCYNNHDAVARKLKIKEKNTGNCSNVILDHNSAVLFSVATNKDFVHKIILDKITDDQWLGITFRFSRTFIKFIDHVPYFINGKILKLANEDEIAEFRKYKGVENLQRDFKYPELSYTTSKSDLICTV